MPVLQTAWPFVRNRGLGCLGCPKSLPSIFCPQGGLAKACKATPAMRPLCTSVHVQVMAYAWRAHAMSGKEKRDGTSGFDHTFVRQSALGKLYTGVRTWRVAAVCAQRGWTASLPGLAFCAHSTPQCARDATKHWALQVCAPSLRHKLGCAQVGAMLLEVLHQPRQEGILGHCVGVTHERAVASRARDRHVHAPLVCQEPHLSAAVRAHLHVRAGLIALSRAAKDTRTSINLCHGHIKQRVPMQP